MITLAAIAVGGVTAAILFRLFFTSFAEFVDCLRLYFTPEIISAFRGEWRESDWAYVKVLIYFGLSIGSGFMTRYSLERLFC
jgi:hypothetical protein